MSWKNHGCVTLSVTSVLGSGNFQKWVRGGPCSLGWWGCQWLGCLGIALDLEALELLAGASVESQGIAPVLVQLGRHMQALVLELVVESTDAEVL